MAERWFCEPVVVGSIPILSSMIDVHQVVLAVSALMLTHVAAFYFGSLHGERDSKEEIALLERQVARLTSQANRLIAKIKNRQCSCFSSGEHITNGENPHN